MASLINADNGVVSGSSGLKSTADATGVLALQSNGTTGLTLNTSLALGVGSGNSTGSSGQVLTSAGSGAAPTWAAVPATTPAGSTGQVQYNNAGAFGALSSGTSGQVLTSAGSGAAPTWAAVATPTNNFRSDMSYYDASLAFASSLGTGIQTIQSVALTATTEMFFVCGDSSIHAAVWNTATNTFGTPVLVRSVASLGVRSLAAVAVSSTSVLVCSCPSSSTSLQTVVLSVSGTTITVNTPVNTTLANGINFINGQQYNNYSARLMTFGSSYVLSVNDGTAPTFIAITVSGTTPSVGSALTLSGGSGSALDCVSLAYDASTLLSLSSNGATFYATPVTVSGTSLTQGTGTTDTTNNSAVFNACMLSSGRAFCAYSKSTIRQAAVITVSGGTATSSSVSTTFSSGGTNYAQAIGSQVMYVTISAGANNITVITDSSGTAVKGTSVTGLAAGDNVKIVGTNGTQVFITSSTSAQAVLNYSISGNNPSPPTTFYAYSVLSGFTGISTLYDGAYDTYYANVENSSFLRTAANKHANFAAGNNVFLTCSYDGASAVQYQQPPFINGALPTKFQRSALNTYTAWQTAFNSSTTSNLIVRRITLS